MDILRIATAGSVDDGKSTLIGRLLYETQSITKDKIEALESASKRKGLDFLDLSLLTDGLIAEREQGITIDVAHIYFSTSKRKYIIADTPGHFEYTRNMVTGASNTQVSIILVDARQGVLEQTYRHFFIATMLRIPNVIVCVNKMDLVDYSESKFDGIVTNFKEMQKKNDFNSQNINFIPISSLYGENITKKSSKTAWYKGDCLLDILENISPKERIKNNFARFPIQLVIRPKTESFHDYRGYAGKIASGTFRIGEKIVVLPTERSSTITSIEKFGEKQEEAQAGESVIITLADDVDISRGNMLVKAEKQPIQRKEIVAQICWLDANSLTNGKSYILQHGVNQVKAKVTSLNKKIDVVQQSISTQYTELGLNEIGEITIKVAKPIFADTYKENPTNGAFILIDEFTNATVGVGFVQ